MFLLCCLRKFGQKFLLYLNSRIVFSFYAFHSTKFHNFYSVSNRKSQHMMNYSQIFYYYYFLTVRNQYPTLAAVYSLRSMMCGIIIKFQPKITFSPFHAMKWFVCKFSVHIRVKFISTFFSQI